MVIGISHVRIVANSSHAIKIIGTTQGGGLMANCASLALLKSRFQSEKRLLKTDGNVNIIRVKRRHNEKSNKLLRR
jgi:hypothetical protein